MADQWFAAKVHQVSIPTRLMPRETGENTPASYRYVVRNLEQQEFTVLCPVVTDIIVIHGQKTSVNKPGLPGYIFIVLDLDDPRWPRARNTQGVDHLLPKHSLRPHPVPDEFID